MKKSAKTCLLLVSFLSIVLFTTNHAFATNTCPVDTCDNGSDSSDNDDSRDTEDGIDSDQGRAHPDGTVRGDDDNFTVIKNDSTIRSNPSGE